jgi:hypothetical protein
MVNDDDSDNDSDIQSISLLVSPETHRGASQFCIPYENARRRDWDAYGGLMEASEQKKKDSPEPPKAVLMNPPG